MQFSIATAPRRRRSCHGRGALFILSQSLQGPGLLRLHRLRNPVLARPLRRLHFDFIRRHRATFVAALGGAFVFILQRTDTASDRANEYDGDEHQPKRRQHLYCGGVGRRRRAVPIGCGIARQHREQNGKSLPTNGTSVSSTANRTSQVMQALDADLDADDHERDEERRADQSSDHQAHRRVSAIRTSQ